MTKISARGLAGKFLAAIGVLVIMGEIALHFISWYTAREYEMNHAIVLAGSVLGFVGFLMLDMEKTLRGAGFLVDSASKLIPRFGRRQSDAIAVPGVTTATTAVPVPPKGEGE